MHAPGLVLAVFPIAVRFARVFIWRPAVKPRNNQNSIYDSYSFRIVAACVREVDDGSDGGGADDLRLCRWGGEG